jgi:predicted transcriptional regulator of viral defense system
MQMWFTFLSVMGSFRVFSVADVKKAFPAMNLMNLVRWQKKGFIIKIRNGWYCFNDSESTENINWLAANLIYAPSCISLHSALSYYGLIPEAIFGTTSITTRKTNYFMTPMGSYSYHHVKRSIFGLGQTLIQADGKSSLTGTGRKIVMAEPEKALLDFLYIHNQYDTVKELEHLRLDESLLEEILNVKFYSLLAMYANRSLEDRVGKMRKAYAL